MAMSVINFETMMKEDFVVRTRLVEETTETKGYFYTERYSKELGFCEGYCTHVCYLCEQGECCVALLCLFPLVPLFELYDYCCESDHQIVEGADVRRKDTEVITTKKHLKTCLLTPTNSENDIDDDWLTDSNCKDRGFEKGVQKVEEIDATKGERVVLKAEDPIASEEFVMKKYNMIRNYERRVDHSVTTDTKTYLEIDSFSRQAGAVALTKEETEKRIRSNTELQTSMDNMLAELRLSRNKNKKDNNTAAMAAKGALGLANIVLNNC